MFNRQQFTTPTGIRLLIIINVIVFIILELSGMKNELFRQFGLVPRDIWTHFKIWQTVSYMFLHDGFFHILFNLFVLWMFGRDLEINWGKREFLRYYFVAGIGSGVITMLFSLESFIPVVGASGAIYGLLLAYGIQYPNRLVYLYLLIPVKVKYVVAFLAVIAFVASFSPERSTISHMTHLSGMAIGYIYLRFNLIKISVIYFLSKSKHIRLKNIKKQTPNAEDPQNLNKKVDEILDKINKNGWESLSETEQLLLQEASKRFYSKGPPN